MGGRWEIKRGGGGCRGSSRFAGLIEAQQSEFHAVRSQRLWVCGTQRKGTGVSREMNAAAGAGWAVA